MSLFFDFLGTPPSAYGAHVAYSWTGSVRKSPFATADPWSVGDATPPFHVAIFVPDNAHDWAPFSNTLFLSWFSVSAVSFSIDGAPVDVDWHHGTIPQRMLFWDDNRAGAATNDQISLNFSGTRDGVTLPVSLVAHVESSAFTFVRPQEAPPIFGSAAISAKLHVLADYYFESEVGVIVKTPVVALPGDFNRNGATDGGDFLYWQRSVGSENLAADANFDGRVDIGDGAIWQTFFAQTTDALQISVPEPPASWIAIAGGIGAVLGRCHLCRGRLPSH